MTKRLITNIEWILLFTVICFLFFTIDVVIAPPPNETGPVDKCVDVVCQDISKTCPDGLEAKCTPECNPTNGKCNDCTPDCTGHETSQEEEKKPYNGP